MGMLFIAVVGITFGYIVGSLYTVIKIGEKLQRAAFEIFSARDFKEFKRLMSQLQKLK